MKQTIRIRKSFNYETIMKIKKIINLKSFQLSNIYPNIM